MTKADKPLTSSVAETSGKLSALKLESSESASNPVTDKPEKYKLPTKDKQSSTGSTNDIAPTVFKSTKDFSLVHPLSNSWTLWYLKPRTSSDDDWQNLLTQVIIISTVEDFWAMFNGLPKVTNLADTSGYALFKDGICPEWEDARNNKGGKWVHEFRDRKPAVDSVWLHCLLGIIGETIDLTSDPKVGLEEQEINGIFVNVKRDRFKLNIWTKSTGPLKTKPIGLNFKKLLNVGRKAEVNFSEHNSRYTKFSV